MPALRAQESKLSLHTKDKKLSIVLEEIAQAYHYHFAYDADYFSTLLTHIDIDNTSIDQFLSLVCKQHSLAYKFLNGTYVLYPVAREKKAVQKNIIQGKVSDINTGEPLTYSYIFYSSTGAMTNEMGHFSIQDNSGKPLAIGISHLGYHRLDTLVQPGFRGLLNLKLTPFVMELAEINVKAGEKNMLELTSNNEAIAFNPRQTASVPRVDQNDMVNALTLIPGINFLGGSYSGLSIRGGSPSENLITIDGIPVLETNHLFGNVSALNAKYIRQAFVSRGGFDVSSGNRISGIVELIGKTGNKSNPELDLSAGLLNGNAFAAIPIGKKVSLSGAWNQSYVDQWHNYLFMRLQGLSSEEGTNTTNGEAMSLVPGIRYKDANAKLSFRPNENQEININGMLSKESMHRDFQFYDERSFKEESANGESKGGGINWSVQYHNWLNKFSVSTVGMKRNSLMEAGRFINTGIPDKRKNPVKGSKYEMESDQNKVQEQKIAWQSSITHSIFQHKFGAGWTSDDVTYGFESQIVSGNIPVDSLNVKRKLNIYHAYYQQEVTPWKPLKLRMGLRADYNLQAKDIIYQPRAGIYLTPVENIEFYYLAGKYAQYLSQIRKIDSFGNFALAWYLPGQSGEGLLKSVHHVAGVKLDKGKLLVNLELYKKVTDGKINLFAEMYKKGKETRIEYKTTAGNEITQGIDVFLQYQANRWTQMLAYTLSKSEEKYEGINMGEYFPSFNDQRHRLRITEIYKIKSWTASGSWTFNTGYPTPVTALGEDAVQFGRLSNFSQLDLGLVKRFRYRHLSLDAGASLLNVFNRKNILEKDYFSISDATGTSTLRSEITAISCTPVFYINLRIN